MTSGERSEILGIRQCIGDSQLGEHYLQNNFHLMILMAHVIGAMCFLHDQIPHLVIQIEIQDPGNLAEVPDPAVCPRWAMYQAAMLVRKNSGKPIMGSKV